jgi:hypothetical protein
MLNFIVNYTNSTTTTFNLTCYDNKNNLTPCVPGSSDAGFLLEPSSIFLGFFNTINYIKFTTPELANPMTVYYTAPDQNDPACITPESEFSGPYSFVGFYSEGTEGTEGTKRTCNFAISSQTSK